MGVTLGDSGFVCVRGVLIRKISWWQLVFVSVWREIRLGGTVRKEPCVVERDEALVSFYGRCAWVMGLLSSCSLIASPAFLVVTAATALTVPVSGCPQWTVDDPIARPAIAPLACFQRMKRPRNGTPMGVHPLQPLAQLAAHAAPSCWACLYSRQRYVPGRNWDSAVIIFLGAF